MAFMNNTLRFFLLAFFLGIGSIFGILLASLAGGGIKGLILFSLAIFIVGVGSYAYSCSVYRCYSVLYKIFPGEQEMGVSQKTSIIVSGDRKVVFEKCIEALSSLEHTEKVQSDSDNGVVESWIRRNPKSAGEKLHLRIRESDSKYVVEISSQPISKLIIFDTFKNALNVRKVREVLERPRLE